MMIYIVLMYPSSTMSCRGPSVAPVTEFLGAAESTLNSGQDISIFFDQFFWSVKCQTILPLHKPSSRLYPAMFLFGLNSKIRRI